MGFGSAKVNGKIVDLSEDFRLDKQKKHNVSIIIDKLVRKADIRARLSQSVETALKLTGGLVAIQAVEVGGKEIVYNTKFACPISGISFPDPEPRLFSFNSPVGACPRCNGLGYRTVFDPDLIVSDKTLSIEQGALSAWVGEGGAAKTRNYQVLENLARHFKFDLKLPFYRLSEETKKLLFHGSGKEEIQFKLKKENASYRSLQAFDGIIPDLERTLKNASPDELEFYEELQAKLICGGCSGDRLKPETLAFKIAGKNIADFNRLSLDELRSFFRSLRLEPQDASVAKEILKEIDSRIGFLLNVGLDYLSLARPSASLSGGEIQAGPSSGFSIFSTNPPSACTSATIRSSSSRCVSCKGAAIPSSSSSMIAKQWSPRISSSISVRARVATAAISSPAAILAKSWPTKPA